MNYIAKTYLDGNLLEAEFEAHNKECRSAAEKAMKAKHGTSKVMSWSPVIPGFENVVCRWMPLNQMEAA